MAPRTPDIVEHVAVEVSARLRADTAVGRESGRLFQNRHDTAREDPRDPKYPRGVRGRCAGSRNESPVQRPGLDQGFRRSDGLAILPAAICPIPCAGLSIIVSSSFPGRTSVSDLRSPRNKRSRDFITAYAKHTKNYCPFRRGERANRIRTMEMSDPTPESFTPRREESLANSRQPQPARSSAS